MIKEFRGKTKWLSNFSPVKIVIDGIELSAKCDNTTWKKVCANETITCGQIKFLGSTVKLVDNWMTECVNQKFTQQPYRDLLLATGDQFIQEGNNWGDLIWGVDIETGEGQNLLGKLIMEFRETL